MSFDISQFMDLSVNEANDTVMRPVPEGEFVGVIVSVEPRVWTSKEDSSKSGIALDLQWELDDAALKEELGRTPKVKQGIMLDMAKDGKSLDMGKGMNVGLGRLRAALGLNVPGVPFAFSHLPGRAAKVKVSHRPDANKTNPDGTPVVYAEVREVAGL